MSTRIVSRWLIINTKYTTLIMSARLKGSRSIDLKITTTQFLNLLLLLLLFWIGSLLTLRNQIDWQMSNKNWPSLCAHYGAKNGKKCNFKTTKTHFLQFQKWQKSIFAPEKRFKTTKNAIFCHFWNCKKCVFALLKLQLFF